MLNGTAPENNEIYIANIAYISTNQTSLCSSPNQPVFYLSSIIIIEVSIFGNVIYSSTQAYEQQCAPAEEYIISANKFILSMMVIERWDLPRWMVGKMVTMALGLWRYLKYLR